MKRLLSRSACVLAFVSGFVSLNAFANDVSLSSVKDSAELLNLLENLEVAASEGASISSFSWSEKFDDTYLRDCETLSGTDVRGEFENMAIEIFDGADSASSLALNDFSSVIGSGKYKSCHDYFTEARTLNRVVSFVSESSPYRIQFVISFED